MNRIYELRTRANMSQSKLASQLQIANNTLSQYENEKRQIPDDIKIKLTEIFNCSIDYLLGRDNTTPNLNAPETLDNVKFAFSDGLKDLTQEDLDDVAKYVEFLREKRKKG